jgi:hypothetical protein
MGGAYGTYGVLVGKPEGNIAFGRVGQRIDVRIILKLILNKEDAIASIVLI